MNPPFALSAIGAAVVSQVKNDHRSLVMQYEAWFDAFHALMIQLPENHAIGTLLLAKRYGSPNMQPGANRYA